MVTIKRLLATVAILLGGAFSIPSYATSATAEWCDRQWRTESAKADRQDPPDYAGLLKRWQQYGPKCANTVAYEARLAIACSLMKQPDKAREVLKPLARTPSDYSYLVDFSLLHADMAEVMNRTIKMEDVRRLEEKYLAFVKRYPEFPDGHGMLGGIQTILEKHDDAIKSLEVGLRSAMDVSGVYRNLTISYTAVGRYEEAIRVADKAFQLNRRLTSDPDFAFALAKADAGIGNFHAAETVLRVIAAKVPEVRSDPDFKEAVDFVTAKMQGK